MKVFVLSVLIVSSLSISPKLVANNEPPLQKDSITMSYTVDEVVVEGFKSNNHIERKPISANLLTANTIKERNITSLKDISALVPNLYISNYGSKLTTSTYIRGIGSSINSPSVGLYVDGVPFFDRAAFDFNILEVDRIEVLRGPQGTIYGRNTMGGLINVYTKSPLTTKGTFINASAANHETYNISGSQYGQIGKKLGYAASAGYYHTDGFFFNTYNSRKADRSDNFIGRINLAWKATDRLMFNLISVYEYSDEKGYPYRLYNDSTGQTSPINYNAPSYYRRNMSTTGLNVRYKTDKIELSSQSSFQFFDGKHGLDQDYGPTDEFYLYLNQYQRMVSQELNIKSTHKSNYEWLFGAFGFYQNYTFNNEAQYRLPMYMGLKTYQDIKNPSKGIAFFHQSTFNNLFVDRLSAIIGVRYDFERIKDRTILSNYMDRTGMITQPMRKGDKNYSQFTPKVSLQYSFAKNDIVYASVARGYKAGGFNSAGSDKVPYEYDPEYSWSYEVGTKATCFNGLLYTDISLFYINWHDQQVTQYELGGSGLIVYNAGKTHSKGFEINVHSAPIDNLLLTAGYGYTHAKFKKFETSTANYTNNFLPMVPRHTVSANANYSLHISNSSVIDKIVFDVLYKGIGKMYWREDNVPEQPYYGLWDGQISFVKNDLSLDLWTKNIFDTRYNSFYVRSKNGDFVQMGRPFTCGVNVSMKF